MSSATGSQGGVRGRRITRIGAFTLGVLVLAWLTGGIVHARSMIATGWGDISPSLAYLGLGLVLWAGVTAWALVPGHGRKRTGAYAGMLTFAVTVAGQFLLVLLFMDPANLGSGDETWFSFLLESWFWIGVPLVVSATLGALGWLAADGLDRYTHPRPPFRMKGGAVRR